MVARQILFVKYKDTIYSVSKENKQELDRQKEICYSVYMNAIQKQILDLATTVDLSERTYYGLAKMLQVNHPYKVQFAIEQLLKKGKLVRDAATGSIVKPKDDQVLDGMINIPYYGLVNCGEALAFAQDRIEGYLKVTPNVISLSSFENLFALKASGNSMNDATIGGSVVDDGDYVIARKKSNYLPSNGDYVISIIGGAANLKKFRRDVKNRQIVLESESTENLPPIVISEEDIDSLGLYSVAAQAVAVVKMS